jgi:hypothetical protein
MLHYRNYHCFHYPARRCLRCTYLFTPNQFKANTTQVGWVMPFLWAGIWAAITIPWVQRDLTKEYEEWTTANFKA